MLQSNTQEGFFMLNPVLPPPRTRRIQTARNAVDVILNARSAADLRLYEWEDRGKAPSGKTKWYDTETKKTRYQISKPGTGRGKKAPGDATSAPAEGEQPAAKQPAQKKQAAPRKPKVDHNEVGDRIEKMLGTDFADQDVGALREELLSLTKPQMLELSKRFDLKGGRTKADVAGRIAGHVGGSRKRGEQPAPEAASEKPTPAAATMPGQKKEPWETSRGEYANSKRLTQPTPQEIKAEKKRLQGEISLHRMTPQDAESKLNAFENRHLIDSSHDDAYHKMYVESALKKGKPVPPEVLADYPDLAQKYGQKPEAAPAPEKPVRKPRAAKQPVRQPEPTPEPGKPGGRYDDLTREQIYDELAMGNLQNRTREDQPIEGFLNPRGYEGFPEGIDAEAVTASTVDAVRKATANTYTSPTIRGVFDAVKQSHPEITLDQFQQALAELHRQKKIELTPHTSAPSTIPDDQIRYVFPLDGEPKMFVGLGANAGQVKPGEVKPAAAPTPASAPQAPTPAPQPRTPNAATRNRLTASVKPSPPPAGKPQAKRTGRGILNARNPVDVVLFARSPQQARPLLYAWLRTASKRNPGKTVWVNSTNPKDRRYQEAMPKQRATQSVESLPPQDHLQQILEAPYRVADYYLTSLQTRLRRMRPGALAALRMQFDKEG